MDISSLYRLLPGKNGKDGSYLPLWMHLQDTADVIEYLCQHRVSKSILHACALEPEEFRKTAVFLAMVHDLGKCTPLFLHRITAGIPNRKRRLESEGLVLPTEFLDPGESHHTIAGEAILQSLGVPGGLCSIVGAHHGMPSKDKKAISNQTSVYKFNLYAKQEALWSALQREILQNALLQSGYEAANALPKVSVSAQMLFCGLLIQADWIASNETYFPLFSEETSGSTSCYPERSAAALVTLHLPDCQNKWGDLSDTDALFRDGFGFSPNAMQRCAADAARKMSSVGLMIIEAQMGSGKTEAALAACEILAANAGCEGVFFGLPTQATTNGAFPRLTDWAENLSRNTHHTVRLVHGMAELNEDYLRFFRGAAATDDDGDSKLTAHAWFRGRKQALLADYVVGTVDTVLMAALSQKHVMLRHLGLCGKVVIIDEVHAYDAYMSRFLCRLLRWLGTYQVPVILLSATLPREKKKELLRAYSGNKKLCLPEVEGYPLITVTQGESVCAWPVLMNTSSRQIAVDRVDEADIVKKVAEKQRDGGCVGIIVNTVKRAQLLAKTLTAAFPEKQVLLYHAQFISEERIHREKELMDLIGKHSTAEKRSNVIVVGTQVLEQSLDIDFDYLISDLCPIDLLLQRMGRLHRHTRIRPALLQTACCSVLCGDEASKRIYDEWLLSQTEKHLPQAISLPEDIPGLVEAVYAAVPDDQRDALWLQYQDRIKKEENKAGVWLLKEPRMSKYEIRNSLVGMMEHPIENEQHAEASVRDGLPSVEVLVMRTVDEEHLGFLSRKDASPLRKDAKPSEEEAKKIALQRLRLPTGMCLGKQLEDIVTALEKENSEVLPLWQDSPWLKGELILILDEKGEKGLCRYTVKYEKDIGLVYERRSD